jgi:hypothetical protein
MNSDGKRKSLVIFSAGKKKAQPFNKKVQSPNSAGKKKASSPNSAGKQKAQSLNVPEVSSHVKASSPVAEEVIEEEDHHKKLFYEQLQLSFSTDNQRKLMGRKQLNDIIEVVKGDRSHMKGDSRQATLYYKYKKDFAVLFFGNDYSLVESQHTVRKSVIDISTVPRYACYEELYDCIKQCHIDQEGHSGIRKIETSVKNHFVNISREMCASSLMPVDAN